MRSRTACGVRRHLFSGASVGVVIYCIKNRKWYNYDARREGPKNAMNVGDSVAYYREELVDWLLTRWMVTPRKTREERLLDVAARSGKQGKRSRGFSRA